MGAAPIAGVKTADTVATLSLPAHAPLSPLPPAETISAIAGALGLDPSAIIDSAFDASTGKLLLVVESRASIAALAPVSSALLAVDQLAAAPTLRVTGVSVTCLAEGVASGEGAYPFKFYSRYFSPWNGIPYAGGEDPANGSSHTLLYPFYARQLSRDGEDAEAVIDSKQGGVLWINYTPGTSQRRVDVTGCARTVCSGTFQLIEE
jgi:predicted PhzF superfamily epimerase YddE/YHI9